MRMHVTQPHTAQHRQRETGLPPQTDFDTLPWATDRTGKDHRRQGRLCNSVSASWIRWFVGAVSVHWKIHIPFKGAAHTHHVDHLLARTSCRKGRRLKQVSVDLAKCFKLDISNSKVPGNKNSDMYLCTSKWLKSQRNHRENQSIWNLAHTKIVWSSESSTVRGNLAAWNAFQKREKKFQISGQNLYLKKLTKTK